MSWSFWTCVPGVYTWGPWVLRSECLSDKVGTGHGMAMSLFQIWAHLFKCRVGRGVEGQAQRRTEVGEAEWEATYDNATHISWLNHLVLPLGKFLLVFCLTVSLRTSCYELVKKIIITWLWEMVMKYTLLYSKGTRLLPFGRDRKSKPPF